MRHYKDIIDRQTFEATYSLSLDDFELYAKRNKITSIPTKCDNCGEIFWMHKAVFKKRLCYTEYYEKCFGDTWFCMKDECTSAKKSLVCVDRMLQNQDSIEKRLAASKNRRGKTYEEQYGEEKAQIVKAVIKQKRKEQSEPMLGKHHSDKAKLKMSLSKQELASKGELNWTNPITGEPCTYRDRIDLKVSLWHKDEANRKDFARRVLEGQMKSWKDKKSIIHRWYDNEPIPCQSSYEETYVKLLNDNKVYFDRCSFILPYKFENRTRHYSPDFEIYSDSSCTTVTHIVEVKPKIFLEKDCKYTKKNLAKLEVLKSFCGYNNYKMVIITEEQLNEHKIY